MGRDSSLSASQAKEIDTSSRGAPEPSAPASPSSLSSSSHHHHSSSGSSGSGGSNRQHHNQQQHEVGTSDHGKGANQPPSPHKIVSPAHDQQNRSSSSGSNSNRRSATRAAMDAYTSLLSNVVGPLSNGYFESWTREEVIIVLVNAGIEVRNEDIVPMETLIETAEDVFHAIGSPRRPDEPSPNRLKRQHAAALKIQKAWIAYVYKQINSIRSASPMRAADMAHMTEEEQAMALMQDQAQQDADDIADGVDMDIEQGHLPEDSMERSLDPELIKPWVQPSLQFAEIHAYRMHPHRSAKRAKYTLLGTTTGRHCTMGYCGEQCDLWQEGQVSEFGKFGPGISNYFKFIKWCFWIFVIISALQAVPLAFNTYGDERNIDGSSIDYLFRTTVGNLGDTNTTYYIDLPGCQTISYDGSPMCHIEKKDLAILYSALNVICAVVILVGFVWLCIFEKKEERTLDKNTVSASDYTVEVSGLPKHCQEMELRAHFARVTGHSVADVCIAYDSEKEIEMFKERGELLRKRVRCVQMYRYYYSLPPTKRMDTEFFARLDEERQKVNDKIHKIDEKMKKRVEKGSKHDEVLYAFVTFEEAVGSQVAIQIYRDSLWSYFYMSPEKRFKGHRIRVTRAPPPSTIIWENLKYSRCDRFTRRVGTWAISIMLLLISAIASFSSRALEQQAQIAGGDLACPGGFNTWSREDQKAYAESNPGTEHCYCSNLNPYDQSQDSLCQEYYRHQVNADMMAYFGAFVVVFINGLIDIVLKRCAEYEKHHSLDQLEMSVFVRLFLLKIINSGILFLLTNIGFIIRTVYGLQFQDSSDFDPSWFSSIGINIMLVQIGDIIMPHFWKFYARIQMMWNRYKQRHDSMIALSQDELNRLYEGPEFLISHRYSQLMCNFFICLIFCPGMPALALIGMANFYISYWIDKYLFINFYRTPPYYNGKIGRIASSFIPYAVLIYLGVAVWTFGNRKIFQTQNEDSYSNYYSSYDSGNVAQKLSQAHVIPLFALFVALLFALVVSLVVHGVVARVAKMLQACCCGYFAEYEKYFQLRQFLRININVAFSRAVRRGIIKGLATYSIIHNPKYKSMFALSERFVRAHKHLRAVYSIRTLSSRSFRELDVSSPQAASEADDTADVRGVAVRAMRQQSEGSRIGSSERGSPNSRSPSTGSAHGGSAHGGSAHGPSGTGTGSSHGNSPRGRSTSSSHGLDASRRLSSATTATNSTTGAASAPPLR